jgi:hypothetical protein
MREDLKTNPLITGPKDAFLRSIQKAEARGFAAGLLKNLQIVDRVTPAGVYIDTKPAIEIDSERIRGLVRKIVKGLYAHHFHQRLPDTHMVKAYSYAEMADPQTGELPDGFKSLTIGLSTQPRHSKGDQFTYYFVRMKDDPHESFWLFVFYQKVIFFGWTRSIESGMPTPEATEHVNTDDPLLLLTFGATCADVRRRGEYRVNTSFITRYHKSNRGDVLTSTTGR